MKFSRVIGKIDPKLIEQAERKLSEVFLELGTRYDNMVVGSGLGGDPFVFTLLYPVQHIATLNIPTAATDGIRYYWNPKFVIKRSKIGLRIVSAHEAFHANYMHPQRRGSRLPKLWNIAIDYIVNGIIMEDLQFREPKTKLNPEDTFIKHLGRFMTLTQYAEYIKDPFAKIKGFDDLVPAENENGVELPAPGEDRELTPQETRELERREKSVKFYFADPNLSEEMKKPERIYDHLYNLLPKCPKCGQVGIYPNPNKNKNKADHKDHDHKDNKKCDHEGGIDIFGLGGSTMDEHMDTEESEEKLAKRLSDAMETSKKMAGKIPAALEEELGKLIAPKIAWKDVIRGRILKSRAGNERNDWTRFRTRPMFFGLLVPKRKGYVARFGCLLDTSGSMSKDDLVFGISQLQGLDERNEGIIVPADAQCYWDRATKIRACNAEELSKVKIVGKGGTMFGNFFSDYEKQIGRVDFLICITDGFLMDTDIAAMVQPKVPVYWILTSNSTFKAPFGKVFQLRD